MAFCSAGDLSLYIRKRGDLAALTASNQGLLPNEAKEVELQKVLYPHPKEGGLNETIVRCFLGQLRKSRVACQDALLVQGANLVDSAMAKSTLCAF